jgi:hypothetical protein
VIAAQLIGIGAGALVVIPVFALLTNAYGLGSDMLPASAPQSWKATAQAVSAGIDAMPTGAPLAALIGAIAGIVLTIVERTRLARFVPSPIGIGIAFLIPASYSITRALGVLGRSRPAPLAARYRRARRDDRSGRHRGRSRDGHRARAPHGFRVRTLAPAAPNRDEQQHRSYQLHCRIVCSVRAAICTRYNLRRRKSRTLAGSRCLRFTWQRRGGCARTN